MKRARKRTQCGICGSIGHNRVSCAASTAPLSRSRLAVQLIEQTGCDYARAAYRFGISKQAVSLAWIAKHGPAPTPAQSRRTTSKLDRQAAIDKAAELHRSKKESVRLRAMSAISNGATIAEVSRDIGVSYHTIWEWSAQRGIRSKNKGSNNSGYRTDAAIKLVTSGMTSSEASRVVGISHQAVRTGMKRRGMTP
jgi:transposase-like protein